MPIAITDEQRAVQESIRSWAEQAGALGAVRDSEPGAGRPPASGREFLAGLAGIGVFGMALPEAAGGLGGTVTDLAAALEQAADSLVPGPALPTALAGLLIARHAPGHPLLADLAAGTASVAVALGTGTLVNEGGVLRGAVGPVLGAGATSHLLLGIADTNVADARARTTWVLLRADHRGVHTSERIPVDFSRPLADVRLDGVSAGAVIPGLVAAEVTDLAATLAAAEATGVAAWCLRTAVSYARVREQFGRPIGSFQAVKHLCAEMLCRVEQAAAVAWDAARSADEAPAEHPLAAAVAAAVALDAAVEVAKDCIQVLGGIGFTWEHDAHLYLRRALALRQLLGGGARWRRRVAELALGGARRHLAVDLTGDPAEAERDAVRATVADIAALPEQGRRRRLADTGYLAPHWPAPYGLDASPARQLLIDEELARAGVSRPDLVIGGWAVPTILRHGTDEQRERFVRPTLRGEIVWCQLFSEPGAGSDLAALRTRAVRTDGGWLLTGQKVWTSLAGKADWAICLARTDPDAPRHRGITYFLVDMRAPGIDVRPLREITGEAVFNEVFLDGVFVPDGNVVGEVNGGWRLARTTLANERVAMGGGSSLGDGLERVLDLARRRGVAGDAGVAERLGALVAEAIVVGLLDLRATLRRLGGQDPGPESSVRKLVGVRHRQAVAETALDLAGPDGAAADEGTGALVHDFLLSRCLSIAGGTTQILLTLAGERILGLPRD
ncbi:acyl-CoA dehydrogenase [Gandjariella thermophila]|uniref:Acyl-CoA dehydrogenase n=1 Tax=Gandjariella thermophila TaxID=1931992 RepID=A0A4D4J1E5_9PSEU|nr:acyl-CoA dehydrogenase [Gandjariella thermophila]GDY28980.1 acyl-CoA dehydrogenase [Gandjariella thermophila]